MRSARESATTARRWKYTTKGKNIFEVLDMTVDEGLEFFAPLPKIARKLQTLHDVGLGYIKLGQPSTTAFRRRGAAGKAGDGAYPSRATGKTIYILDEPTTGLHTADVHKLVGGFATAG